MKVPFVDFKWEYREISGEIYKKLKEVLKRQYFILGPELESFQQEFASYLGVKDVIGVGSGTEGLIIALRSLGIGKGDEVIVPTNSFIATAIAVSENGATPVFVDVDKDTYQLDLNDVARKITNKTRAIIPVHLYGSSCNMDLLMDIAKRNKLFVVEDACQAHGATYENKKLGTFGDLGVFSFYPTKNLGAYGDGGAICTNNKELVERIRKLRNYGQSKKYYHDTLGVNSRLDEIQAAVLRVKLKHLDEWNTKRVNAARLYKSKLVGVKVQKIEKNVIPNYHLFVVEVENRQTLIEKLNSLGIQTLIHYPVPIHLQRCYQNLEYKKEDLPIAEQLSERVLSIPMFPYIKSSEIEFVSAPINSFYA